MLKLGRHRCSDKGLSTVPVLWSGTFDEKAITKAFSSISTTSEGYVVRLAEQTSVLV